MPKTRGLYRLPVDQSTDSITRVLNFDVVAMVEPTGSRDFFIVCSPAGNYDVGDLFCRRWLWLAMGDESDNGSNTR